jgi:hypothetical protein
MNVYYYINTAGMMARFSLIVFLLAASAGKLPADEAPPPAEPASSARLSEARRLLVFYGNVVLPDEVYLAVISLPEGSAADKDTALRVREQCQAFLLNAGYDLARVEAAAEDGRIRVDIDEGHLEKIIFRGTSSLRTVQALVTLNLSHNVFNRPYLERQLARLKRESGVEVTDWKLIKSEIRRKIGPEIVKLEPPARPAGAPDSSAKSQIKGLGTLIGRSLIPPRADHELHILFKRRVWSTGVGLVASVNSSDGFKLGLRYRDEGLLFQTDRWAAEGTLGLTIRNNLDDQHAYLAVQRAAAGASWYSPPFLGQLRPALVLRGELTSRQRPDLGLESYYVTRAQTGVALSYDLFPGGNVSLGSGAERVDVFDLEQVDPLAASQVSSGTDTQPYLDAALQLTFNPDELRADRRHELTAGGRQRLSDDAYGVATYRYQYIIPVGWHDIGFTSRGAYVWGQAPFFEEQAVGGAHIRGIFASRFFARRVVSGGLELRYSLVRDVYKAGVFADTALFSEIDSGRQHSHASVVTGVGPSFHILIASAFQLDLFYTIAVVSPGIREHGFSAVLNQAF